MTVTQTKNKTHEKPRPVTANRQGQPHGHLHGYLALLGVEPMDTMGLLHRIEIGFSFKELEHFQAVLSMPMERVAELVHITPRTLNRRKEQGRLLPDESDRLVRISRVFGRTLELFEDDVEAARHWLSSPQPALGGAVPLSIAKTDTGSREVEDLIGRLEHGVFS